MNAELEAAGAWVFAGGLHPPNTATVVRLKGNEVLTTDGPYIEGKEHIGGFTVIQAPDLDVALELPIGIVTALFGTPFFVLIMRRRGRTARPDNR